MQDRVHVSTAEAPWWQNRLRDSRRCHVARQTLECQCSAVCCADDFGLFSKITSPTPSSCA